jgi:hypothetical protein
MSNFIAITEQTFTNAPTFLLTGADGTISTTAMTHMRTVSIGPLFLPVILLGLAVVGWCIWRFMFAKNNPDERQQ